MGQAGSDSTPLLTTAKSGLWVARSLSYERLLSLLSQCEFSIAKSQQGCQMNAVELENYETLYKKIETGIESVKSEIVDAKEELSEAKQVHML